MSIVFSRDIVDGLKLLQKEFELNAARVETGKKTWIDRASLVRLAIGEIEHLRALSTDDQHRNKEGT